MCFPLRQVREETLANRSHRPSIVRLKRWSFSWMEILIVNADAVRKLENESHCIIPFLTHGYSGRWSKVFLKETSRLERTWFEFRFGMLSPYHHTIDSQQFVCQHDTEINFLSIQKLHGVEGKGPQIDRFFGRTPLSSSINHVHAPERGIAKRCKPRTQS